MPTVFPLLTIEKRPEESFERLRASSCALADVVQSFFPKPDQSSVLEANHKRLY